MNYQKIYNQLIQFRKQHPAKLTNIYTETHHIIPKSIDKSKQNQKSNLVSLTPRQHFIAHLLLVKIYEKLNESQNYRKMLYAFNLMWNKNKSKKSYAEVNFNSRLYQMLRIKAIKTQSEYMKQYFLNEEKRPFKQKNGMYGKCWITNINTNQNKLISKTDPIPVGWRKGKYVSQEFKQISIMNLKKYSNIKRKWIKNIQLGICKLIPINQEIPNGWVPGSIVHFSNDGMNKLKTKNSLSEDKLQEHINFLTPIYNQFLELKKDMSADKAYEILKQKYKSPYSYHNFLWKCKHYLKNYITRVTKKIS